MEEKKFYLAESEGANFWLGVLNDLKERGVDDNSLRFPTAINSVFSNAEMYRASNKEFTKICIEQGCESFHE